jgi:hypothetical protein
MGLIASGIDAQAIDRPGGIFVRLADQIANEDRILLQSVARAIISDARGTLAEQIKRPAPPAMRMPPLLADSRGEYADAGPARIRRAWPGAGKRHRRLHAGWPRIRHHHQRRSARRRRGPTCWPIRSSAR